MAFAVIRMKLVYVQHGQWPWSGELPR